MVELVSEFTPVISHVYRTSRKLQVIVGGDGKQRVLLCLNVM